MVVFNYEWTATVVLAFFAIFMLPSFLRAGAYTVPEFLEHRYDVRCRRAFTLFNLLAIVFIDTAGALYPGVLVISLAIPPVAFLQQAALLPAFTGPITIPP